MFISRVPQNINISIYSICEEHNTNIKGKIIHKSRDDVDVKIYFVIKYRKRKAFLHSETISQFYLLKMS